MSKDVAVNMYRGFLRVGSIKSQVLYLHRQLDTKDDRFLLDLPRTDCDVIFTRYVFCSPTNVSLSMAPGITASLLGVSMKLPFESENSKKRPFTMIDTAS